MALWVLESRRNRQAVGQVASAVYTSGPGERSAERGGSGGGGGVGLRGRLDLVQSDMTTVIEDRRQEPIDEERLCAGDGGSVRLLNVFLCIP